MLKKIVCLLITCLMLFATVASAAETENSEALLPYEPSEDAFCAVAALVEPQGLDLNAVTFMGTFTVGWFLYDPLLRWNDETKEAEPNVITDWEVVDDTTIDITIRDDVYSHNGFKITTDDLLYTFSRVQATPAIEEYAEAIDVDNCVIKDDTHMTIKLKHPSPDQLLYFTQLCMSPTSKEGLEACGGPEANNTNPVACTGPFKFVDWVRGSYMKLERNEDYWGVKPYFKNMEIRFISDNAARLMALQAGDVSAAGQLTNLQVDVIQNDPNLSLFEHAGTTYYYMCLNNKREPFNNVKVRQAMNMVVDRQLILDAIFGGHGDVMDNVLPKSSTRYSAPAEGTEWEYNVEKAQELMAEAGYPNGFDMSIMTLSHQDCIDIAEYLTGALAQIGINVIVDMTETTNATVKQASGDFDAYIISNAGVHGDTGTIRMYDDRLDYADGSFCQFHAQDADAFYELLDQFYVTADPAQSKELAAQIMDVLREEVPTISFINNTELAASRGVTGIRNINGNVILTHLRPDNMEAPAELASAESVASEKTETQGSDGESVDGESADGESADGESADGESADGESADGESVETESQAAQEAIVQNEDGSYTGPVDFQTGEAVMVNLEFDDTTFHAWFDWAAFGDSPDLKGTIEDGILTVTDEVVSMPGVGAMLIGFIQDQLYKPIVEGK